ncbi:insulinase family protein [Leuconostoc pseudomesenteroides]|jgi:predicted Zn-dependent peptidase|uniref:EF-P 5-aminopentanol modification-associated protein YfmF n=1 Tax=Leuconostoc pseudomesenteroides TaxID=33968 RepID=UPI001B8ADC6B|nr:pitrilysin family protein [Leuconostoc pseudomesenteroides]MBS0957235.1 insulinase family protein [Leuconostoc pseudomesenteroides]MCT4381097.1 insulinase family protein [Leuconostoc pseudomesenteroides]MCT4412266.1 insulinase family protein [Leuconostoc pseudomesenteroides]
MKKYRINSGVNLVVLPTTQFKTLHIAIDFVAPALTSNISARSLLSYLMAVSTRQYPTQQEVAQKTIDLYGAQYQTDVYRFGQTHHVRVTLQLPAPDYIDDGNDLLVDAFNFLQEMIFDPLLDGQKFDRKVFVKEQQSLINELESIKDDKPRYAISQLRNITYDVPNLQSSSAGDIDLVKNLTPESLYTAYQNMISSDLVNIVVLGNVNESDVESIIKDWSISPRRLPVLQPFYRQALRPATVEKKQYQRDINQAMLTLAMRLDVPPLDKQRFAAMVMNALLGGSPLSKLFMNVREKASLAYSIYSKWQYDTGFLLIAAGLDADKVVQAEKMIDEEILAIQNGEFEDKVVTSIKKSLINDYLSQQDSPNSQIETAFSRLLTGSETSESEWIKQVQAVTANDIRLVAKKLQIQSRFILLPKE